MKSNPITFAPNSLNLNTTIFRANPTLYLDSKDVLTQDELLRIAALDFTSPYVLAHLAIAFPEPLPRKASSGGRRALTSAEHIQRCEYTRDVFLLCAYTGLPYGDARQLSWQHIFLEQALIRRRINKTGVVALIPYVDDYVLQPVALLESYRQFGLDTCLPFVRSAWLYLPQIAVLAKLTRLKLTMEVGRRTYATLKI